MFILIILLIILLVVAYKEKEWSCKDKKINVRNLPSPPLIMDHVKNSEDVKNLINSKNSCGKCKDIEIILIKKDEKMREEINKNNYVEIPVIDDMNDCDRCKLLISAWKRYFDTVKVILNYVKTGDIDDYPEVETSCNICNHIESRLREYGEKVKEEADCIIAGESNCDKPLYPKDVFNDNKDYCENCENVFNVSTIYTNKLKSIINYIKSSR